MNRMDRHETSTIFRLKSDIGNATKNTLYQPLLKLIPILSLLLISALSFLPYCRDIGFYTDDWHVIWEGLTRGAHSIIVDYSFDRPFVGYIHSLAFQLVGASPFAWQLWAFFVRLLGGFGVYWLALRMFPEHELENFGLAVIFLLFPGYSQHYNASAFSMLELGMAVGIFAALFTVLSFQSGRLYLKILYAILGFIFSLICCLMFEWMIGINIGIILILGYLILIESGTIGKKIVDFLYYLPTLVATLLFLYWRTLIFIDLRNATSISSLKSQYLAQPVQMIVGLINNQITSYLKTLFFSWIVPFYQIIENTQQPDLFFIFLIAVLIAAICYFVAHWVKFNTNGISNWGKVIILGALWVFVTVFPPVFAGREVLLDSGFDRYALAAIFGVALFFIGLIKMTLRSRNAQIWAISVLVFIGSFTQLGSAINFRNSWNYQLQTWWQLYWRAPNLKEGTVLLLYLPPGYQQADDYEVWASADLIYYPGVSSIAIRAEILNQDTLYKLVYQVQDERNMRSLWFERDFSNSLVASMGASTCLHVWDDQNPELGPYENPITRVASQYSNISQIDINGGPNTPRSDIFGEEPPHTWCYYYQKASLARQQQDWTQVRKLYMELKEQGYQPSDPMEWLPFLDAFVFLGEDNLVAEITPQISGDDVVRMAICQQKAKAWSSYPAAEFICPR